MTEAAVRQCEATMQTKADTSPEAMQKMVEAFDKFGVVREQIEKVIQRRIEAIQPAQVVRLKKIYASLRDGMSSVGDWFDPVEAPVSETPATTGTAAAKEAMKKKAKPEPVSDPAPQPDDNGEFLAGLEG